MDPGRAVFLAACSLGLLCLLPGLARAQEPLEPLRRSVRRARTVQVGGEHRVSREEGTVRHALTGGVEIRVGRLVVAADAVCIWHPEEIAADEAGLPVSAFYAEGRVVATLGRDSLRCDRLVYDLEAGRGEAVRLRLRSGTSGPAVGRPLAGRALQVRAERARLEGFHRIEVTDALVTPCTFELPHLGIRCAWAEASLDRPVADPAEAAAAAGGAWIELGPLTAELHGVPVLAAPGAVWSPGWNDLVPEVSAGHSSRLGVFGRTRWDLSAYALALAGIEPPAALRTAVLADHYEERGPLLGLDAGWRSRHVELRGHGVWIRDRGEDLGGIEPPTPDRGRARAFGRVRLPGRLVLEAQAAWQSDRTFLREWFEGELRREVPPETVVQARKASGSQQVSIAGSFRLNDFDRGTERAPLLGHSAARTRIWTLPGDLDLLWSSRVNAGNLRRHAPTTLRVLRADIAQELALPFGLGPLRVDPFVRGRLTAYDRSAVSADDAPWRTTAGAGAYVGTQAWRTLRVPGTARLGIEAFRHVIAPRVGWVSVFHDRVHAPGDPLPAIDRRESLRRTEVLVLEMRNRLLYRRDGTVHELLDLLARARYFPDPGDPVPAGRSWGEVELAAHLHPSRFAELDARMAIDPEDADEVVTRDVALTVRPWPSLALRVGNRAHRARYDAVEAGVGLAVGPHWSVEGAWQHDLATDEPIGATVTLRRTFHDLAIEGRFRLDEGEDDVSVSIHVSPTGLLGGEETDPFADLVLERPDPLE